MLAFTRHTRVKTDQITVLPQQLIVAGWTGPAASLAWTVSSVVANGFRAERWPLWSGVAVVPNERALYLARPFTLQQLALVGELERIDRWLTVGDADPLETKRRLDVE